MEQKDLNEAYVPFRVSTLRGDQKIDFNAYVRVNEKFILYVRKGDSFEGPRLQRLKEKKLKKMFLKPEDEGSYRSYLERNIDMAYDKSSGKSMTNRAEIIQGSQQNQTEEAMDNIDKVEVYNDTKANIEKFVRFLQTEDEAFNAMMAIDNVEYNIVHHGVTVSTLSTMLAAKLGITDPKQTQLIALGAVLHDIDHHKSGLQLSKPFSEFTKDEMQRYKSHPQLGADLMTDKKHIDPLVIKIIAQHEETIDGRGFPRGFQERDIDPMAIIVGVCNALDRKITFEGINKKVAQKDLMISKVGTYPLKYIQLLGDIMSKIE
jgi:putative nucleotidyltransferase with HDIG domain